MKLDGGRVRELRERMALSIEDVSTKARISPHTWVRAEHGEEIRPSSARRVAAAIGVEPGALLALAEQGQSMEEPTPKETRATPTLEEVLQKGVGTHYLALSHEDLEDMYEDSSFEEARALTKQVMAEQKFINDFLKEHESAEISGHWITASQLNRWVSLEGMQRAAQREIDQAREAGDEEHAEKIREGYGLAVQETVGVF